MTNVANFGLGVLFTGVNPDVSQDDLNLKVDRLNRVKEKLDEVARTLVAFCLHKKASVRLLGQTAAEEIEIESIEKAATHSKKYAITKDDIAPSLDLLRQSVKYVTKGIVPKDSLLKMFLEGLWRRKDDLIAKNEWELASYIELSIRLKAPNVYRGLGGDGIENRVNDFS